jgi:hypothetical protein
MIKIPAAPNQWITNRIQIVCTKNQKFNSIRKFTKFITVKRYIWLNCKQDLEHSITFRLEVQMLNNAQSTNYSSASGRGLDHRNDI